MRRRFQESPAQEAPPKATAVQQAHSYESGDEYLASLAHAQVPDSPERRLLRALLADAVNDLHKFWPYRDRAGPQGVCWWRAYRWLLSDDRTYFPACAVVCDVLGIEHDYLKRGIRRWVATQRLEQDKERGTASPTAA